MKRKIIGATVGSPLPKPDLTQTDPTKGDYVKGKEEFLEQYSGNSNKFVVKVTSTSKDDETVYSTDKTSLEIMEAWARNEVISCEYGDPYDFPAMLQLLYVDSLLAVFSAYLNEYMVLVAIEDSVVTVHQTMVITEEYAEHVLQNYALATDIPTDAYINGLIDKKLGNIPDSSGNVDVSFEGETMIISTASNDIEIAGETLIL